MFDKIIKLSFASPSPNFADSSTVSTSVGVADVSFPDLIVAQPRSLSASRKSSRGNSWRDVDGKETSSDLAEILGLGAHRCIKKIGQLNFWF